MSPLPRVWLAAAQVANKSFVRPRPGTWPGPAWVRRDNNATERAIRGPVVGRKNHYGSKSRRGTEVAATLYTILETAKLHELNPAEYLSAALAAAGRGVALLPWQYAAGDR